MHADVFMLVFAYAVHLITSAGEVTAAALLGFSFQSSSLTFVLVKLWSYFSALSASSELRIHSGCGGEVGKWH